MSCDSSPCKTQTHTFKHRHRHRHIQSNTDTDTDTDTDTFYTAIETISVCFTMNLFLGGLWAWLHCILMHKKKCHHCRISQCTEESLVRNLSRGWHAYFSNPNIVNVFLSLPFWYFHIWFPEYSTEASLALVLCAWCGGSLEHLATLPGKKLVRKSF